MGVELKARNLAQVSINLTDFEQTPMHRVYEMVSAKRSATGDAGGSEIVGLVPKKAIEMAADFFLQLETSLPRRCLRIAGGCAERRAAGRGEGREAGGMARPFLDAVANSFQHAGRRKRFGVCWSAGGGPGADGCGAFAEKEIASRILPIGSRRLWTKCEELQMNLPRPSTVTRRPTRR